MDCSIIGVDALMPTINEWQLHNILLMLYSLRLASPPPEAPYNTIVEQTPPTLKGAPTAEGEHSLF
jgi:hypothetical protein